MTLANLLHCVTSLHYTCEPVMLGHRLLELCRLFVDVEPTRYAFPLCVFLFIMCRPWLEWISVLAKQRTKT